MEWRRCLGLESVEVLEERETGAGWVFSVRVSGEGAGDGDGDAGMALREVEVVLSWVDYDHWGGGSVSPASVVRGVVVAAMEAGAIGELGSRFDAARVRRLVSDLDAAVRARL